MVSIPMCSTRAAQLLADLLAWLVRYRRAGRSSSLPESPYRCWCSWCG
ncbi:hypothetical protein HBB16_02555 [Pseudonocardia sp. MCCB 268]|nr:hypothetical protein [Pseudonocardia cytotoxica]